MSTTLHDVLDGLPVAMVTTLVGRRLTSRPVSAAAVEATRVTFLAHREADWVTFVEGREAIVHVTFADEERACWLSLGGTASTTHDPAEVRRLWRREVHGAWFSADDPDAVVIHFDVTDGELWSEAGRSGSPITLRRSDAPEHPRTVE